MEKSTKLVYLNRTKLMRKVLSLNDEYWNNTWEGRWRYMYSVIKELKVLNPETILELGAYKINLTNISDNMDLMENYIDPENLNNKKFIHPAENLPWDIPDKYYDVFVGLQVFEHIGNNDQSKVFDEIMRTSKNAILSFPYAWNSPNDQMHHNITIETISKR